MKLPQLKEIETFEGKIGNVTLTFRKVIISDSYSLNKLSESKNSLDGLLKIIAELMHGYDETVEARLTFLKSIQLDRFSELTEDINLILKTAGLEFEKLEDKKKSTK